MNENRSNKTLFRVCNFTVLKKTKEAFSQADRAFGIEQFYKHGR